MKFQIDTLKNLQNLLNIPIMNYDLSQVDSQKVKSKLIINRINPDEKNY